MLPIALLFFCLSLVLTYLWTSERKAWNLSHIPNNYYTGNGPEEVGALAMLISVSRKHTYTCTHTQLISVIWLV